MRFRAIALVLAVGGLGGCRGGCSRAGPPSPRPSDALGWFPAETQVIVAVDFARLRATPLGTRLVPLMRTNPDDQAQIDEFVRRTGFDPLHHVQSLWVAFPEEARNGGAMGVVLRGRGLHEARLVAYVKDQVQKQGDELFSFRRAGRTCRRPRVVPEVILVIILRNIKLLQRLEVSNYRRAHLVRRIDICNKLFSNFFLFWSRIKDY